MKKFNLIYLILIIGIVLVLVLISFAVYSSGIIKEGKYYYYDKHENQIDIPCSSITEDLLVTLINDSTVEREVATAYDELEFINETSCSDFPLNHTCSKIIKITITNHKTFKTFDLIDIKTKCKKE